MRFESVAPFHYEVEADESSVFIVVIVDETIDIFCKEVVKLLFVKLSCSCCCDSCMPFSLITVFVTNFCITRGAIQGHRSVTAAVRPFALVWHLAYRPLAC